MPGSQLNVYLDRDSFNTPWGFRLQGGKDLNQPLTVQRVFSNSPAEGELQRGDVILAIGGEATSHLSHKLAQDAIKNSGGHISLVVNRPPPGCVHISPLSPPIVTQRPRAPTIQDTPPKAEEEPEEAQYHMRRPAPELDEQDASDLFQEKRPTGPPPKVCSRSNLGGGGINFASGREGSQTLPRTQRRSSQPPSMPSRSPYGGYQAPKGPQYGTSYGSPATTPAQRYEPASQSGVMLNRVQSTLDNITLSPRTPDASHGGQFFQPPPQQQPAQFYTPTSLLIEQQQMEQERQRQQQQQQQQQYQPQQQHYQQQQQPQQNYGGQQGEGEEEEEPIVPVWERRRQFQEAPPQQKAPVRGPRKNPVPKVQRPAPGNTNYSNFGLSYRPQNQQSNAVWQPSPQPKPAQAPPPQVIHFSSTPAAQPKAQVRTPVKASPPSWQRAPVSDDETDGIPAWKNTLRSTGVKQWEIDAEYNQLGQDQEPERSVPYNPTPYQTMHSPKPPGDAGDEQDGGPKVVHLQYNSPMGLYSNENVAETFKGQTNAMSGQQQQGPSQPQASQQGQGGQGLPGGRDWSQSQVFQFISGGGKKSKGKPGPATAPKPHAALRHNDHQPQQQQQQPQRQQHHQPPPPPPQQQHQQAYHDDFGISDF